LSDERTYNSPGSKGQGKALGLVMYASSASNVKLYCIDGLEEKLARCRQSMEEVDLKLRREKLSPEGRKSLERERNLLMTKADNYEKELSVLRKENRKNATLAVAMALLIALIYACWTI
ncbi:PREDICTED: coiled-coil domain-containing protein 167, partial [Pterocles gutturalis]|uniref:coiled-coil domain-containing protein 167 n=1 Tax=Pterocles gutturalis TaxID=240206 RepID=UPI0005287144